MQFFTESEGAYYPTTLGYVLMIAVFLAILALALYFGNKGKVHKTVTRQLVYSAAAMALAFVTSNIKLFHLPMGGSVTLFSMFFICLIGYWFGLSGLFSEKKNGMITGYIVGVIGRFVFSFLSGVIFFGMYAPEGMNPAVYSFLYNGSYIAAEAALTLIVLAVPAVRNVLAQLKRMATS